jgi:hypothetical protein
MPKPPMSAICAARCPNSSRSCMRPPHDDDEHRTPLTEGFTYLYWQDGYALVRYRPGTLDDPFPEEYQP